MSIESQYGRHADRYPLNIRDLSIGNDTIMVTWRHISQLAHTTIGYFNGIVGDPEMVLVHGEYGASLAIPMWEIISIERVRVNQPVWFQTMDYKGKLIGLNVPSEIK